MKQPLRILQLTDSHIFQTDSGKLCGLNTQNSLNQVIALARKKHWPPDIILATGDLCQDESHKSYARFRAIFEKLKTPVYTLPGNHDIPSLMKKTLNGRHVHYRRNFNKGAWQMVLLDSRIPKSTKGHLAKSELAHLRKQLKKYPDQHVLVTFHHQPVPVGSQWLDTMKVDNADELFHILREHKASKVVLFGHIHQQFEGEKNGVALLGAPSTCIQFSPKSDSFSLDGRAPGYRWLKLHDDGSYETGVERVPSYGLTPDLSSKGY